MSYQKQQRLSVSRSELDEFTFQIQVLTTNFVQKHEKAELDRRDEIEGGFAEAKHAVTMEFLNEHQQHEDSFIDSLFVKFIHGIMFALGMIIVALVAWMIYEGQF